VHFWKAHYHSCCGVIILNGFQAAVDWSTVVSIRSRSQKNTMPKNTEFSHKHGQQMHWNHTRNVRNGFLNSGSVSFFQKKPRVRFGFSFKADTICLKIDPATDNILHGWQFRSFNWFDVLPQCRRLCLHQWLVTSTVTSHMTGVNITVCIVKLDDTVVSTW